MSYWVVVSGEYEIVELTADKLVLRGISSPFNGDDPLAWYSTFVPEDAGSGGGGEDPVFDTLIFEEEFDTGTLDTATWNYEIGTGENGWGNGESQYYTDRPENIVVEDGMLKITARQENFAGSAYTSSRIQTYQKFEFQYGRVDIRAKLPTGGGTWPALWLLGSDFETNAWPAAGEIDIMEHVGNQQNTIFGSTHDPANFGGNSRSVNTVVEGVSDDFNVYSIIWSENTIRFLINDEEYGALSNSGSLPFNKDFFLILNVAMGGNFGGAIDPAFSSSTMEVDYIRVYQ
jgi:beta-glucanase (GH16 family)